MQLVINNRQDIVARVENGNSFSKEEFALWRDEIKAARAARREALANMSPSLVLAGIGAALETGTLREVKTKQGKYFTDKYFIIREKRTQTEAERRAALIAKKRAELAKLEAAA